MARKSIKRSAASNKTMEDQTSRAHDVEEDGEMLQQRSSRSEFCKNTSKISSQAKMNRLPANFDPQQVDSACISSGSDVAFFSEELSTDQQGIISYNDSVGICDSGFAKCKNNAKCESISAPPTEAHTRQQSNLESKIGNLSISDNHESDDEGVCLSSVSEVQSICITSNPHQLPSKCSNVNDRITSTALLVYGKDSDGDTMLHIAIIQYCVDLALRFIKIAPWFDWLDIFNENLRQTPLHLAALTRLKGVVRKLMVGGANVEMRDHNGDTPLHIACKKGFFDIVQTLLEPIIYEETTDIEYEVPYQLIPQNLDLKNYDGFTCLHIAAEHNYINIMMHLLAKGADINSGDGKSGKTILHFAAEQNNIQLVKTLLKQNGILVDAKTYNGSTPLLLAHTRNHSAIVELLIQYGANTSCLEESDFSDSDDDD